MTWGNPPKFKSEPAKRSKVITPEQLAASGSEDGEQMAVFCWAANNVNKYPPLAWLHSIPNGGSRHVVEAGKMVAAGLRSGVWDIFLPLPIQDKVDYRSWYNGCYIEMKIKKRRKEKDGGLTEEQIEFRDYAVSMGYYCQVCYSWKEAKDALIAYLERKV